MAPIQRTQDPARIRRRRIEAGLNRKALAEKAGISPQHMSLIENGTAGASPRVLAQLAAALGCTIADLMPPEPSPKPDVHAEAVA